MLEKWFTFSSSFKSATSMSVSFDISSTIFVIFSEYSLGDSSGEGAAKVELYRVQNRHLWRDTHHVQLEKQMSITSWNSFALILTLQLEIVPETAIKSIRTRSGWCKQSKCLNSDSGRHVVNPGVDHGK